MATFAVAHLRDVRMGAAILPLRTENASGEVIFVDTVAANHRATDILNGQS